MFKHSRLSWALLGGSYDVNSSVYVRWWFRYILCTICLELLLVKLVPAKPKQLLLNMYNQQPLQYNPIVMTFVFADVFGHAQKQ